MQQEDIKHIEALNDIRTMMRKSSRFLSLSGLSGIFAGIYALAGFYAATNAMVIAPGWHTTIYPGESRSGIESGSNTFSGYGFYIADAAIVLLLSLLTAYIFSARKAKKNNTKLLDHTAWRLIWQMMVPL